MDKFDQQIVKQLTLNAIHDELQQIPELRHPMTHTVLTEFFMTINHAQ